MPKIRKIKKSLRPVFYIFCEGTKTEPFYLDHYIKQHCSFFRSIQIKRIKLDNIVKIFKNTKTDPISLVTLAIKQKNSSSSSKIDKYWCVYDREARNEVPDKIHIQAFEDAEKNDIKVAFSNVCFEVWLLLHKQNTCAQYVSCNDLFKKSALTQYFPNYSKGSRREFTDDEIKIARSRALQMNANTCTVNAISFSNRIKPCILVKLNPYTNFYQLLDAIDEFILNQSKENNC